MKAGKTIWEQVIALSLAGVGGVKSNVEPTYPVEQILSTARLAELHCAVARALAGHDAADAVFMECIQRSMLFQRDLMFLQDRLAGCCQPVLMKGGALKYLLYPDPAIRPSLDIDLLIRPAELMPTFHLLEKRGFTMRKDWVLNKPISGRLGHEVMISHPQMNLPVELHIGLTQQYRFPHPVDKVIHDSIPLEAFPGLRAPSMPWALVNGAIHMAQRGFKQTLKHLLDIHLISQRLSETQMEEAVRLASMCQAKRSLIYTLKAAGIVFEGKKDPWRVIFSVSGPEVLNNMVSVTPALLLTGAISSDSIGQYMRWLLIKGPLLAVDLWMGPLFKWLDRQDF